MTIEDISLCARVRRKEGKLINRDIKRGLQIGIGLLVLCGAVFGTARVVRAQDETAQPKPQQGGGGMMGGDFLIKSLKASPGCMGVEAAQTQSGKQVIFAWFENKKAVQAWYGSATHTQMMKMMGSPTRPPLVNVKNDKMPIMIIAALTPTKTPDPNVKIPISQISIELYTTVEGGFAYKGRFAPESLKGMSINDGGAYNPKKDKEGN